MDENDENLSAIGFFFDALHEKTLFNISLDQGYSLKVKTIGDNPGHKQSGQYLWPAAEKAANYFIANWNALSSARVLELGAGCGLTGLLISKLKGVEEVVFTDYDYGTLTLIEESIKLNDNGDSQPKFIVDFLQWGDFQFDSSKRLSNESWNLEKFDLIIGTDLIYSKDVVFPLLSTINYFMTAHGTFVLTTSFPLGEVNFLFHLSLFRSL
jgi:predicted nicotinamide N-methyase